MRQALSRVQDELDHAVNAISAYMLACAEAIDGVRVVEAKVRSALEISEEIGCTIHDDGSVSIPYIDLSDAVRYGKADVLLGKYSDLHMCIAAALSVARKVDEELRRKLQELAEDKFEQNGPKEGRHSASPGLPDDADESWSPSEVSAWWGALTDEERQACIERDPLKYGN
ncbi:MAG: alpha/beta hydrolase, partial [Schaalia georgiae]|nr:alpha/beta hydrolase [Schaalia georgiae]